MLHFVNKMIRALLLLFLTVTLTLADSPPLCPYMVTPVCGSDGELYYSECDLNKRTGEDVTVVPWADCQVDCNEPRACTLEYNPRCGSDGHISGNRCGFLWASCGKPAPIVEEPLSNCVDKKCPDNCEQTDADCKAAVSACRGPWKMFMPDSK